MKTHNTYFQNLRKYVCMYVCVFVYINTYVIANDYFGSLYDI